MLLSGNSFIVHFIDENYFTFLLLGGLLVIMIAYHNIKLPATKNLLVIVLILFGMNISNSIERWAMLSSDLLNVRITASVIHYILQPFAIYLELIIIMPQSKERKGFHHILLSVPIMFNTVIYLMAPFTKTLVFYYDSEYHFHRGPLGSTIYIVTFIYLILLFFWSIHYMRNRDRKKSLILFFAMSTAVLTGVLEALNIVSGYIDEAFAIGVFLYYVYLITIHEAEMQANIDRQEIELTQNKVKLLREQIQPHFVFNSLHIIKSLIRRNPEKAVRGVEDFSDYLQANIDAISSDSLISFEEELSHIEAYVSLALADESKKISMHYDIGEKYFRVPPLSIEPIVENAIRHGVVNGGDVWLSTKEEADHYMISVRDNGGGFNAAKDKAYPVRTGIGLNNVSTRLNSLCKGTMDIKSGSGGTTVVIRIPKEN